MSPLARSLDKLRKDGWLAEKVERPWNPHTKRTNDLFGFGDILAVKGDSILIVQSTSGSNASARIEKLRATPNVLSWILGANRRLLVHSWRKLAQGRKKWHCREIEVWNDLSGIETTELNND